MTEVDLWAVILAGGSGTRFWPASRRALPKQFLPFDGRSLLSQTAERLRGAVPFERILAVTSREHASLLREHLPLLPAENVLAEPAARNTAAAIAWAALEIARRDPSAVLAVLPSDHVIAPAEEFRRILLVAGEEARERAALLTFGIRPTAPATGYGWIEVGRRLGERGGVAVSSVARFVEKPDRARAEAFLAGGAHLWNSGMFVWRADAILSALREHAGQLVERLSGALAGSAGWDAAYAALPSASIDTAVLEKASGVRVIPLDLSWSDVGSWDALAGILPGDPMGNRAAGGVRLLAEDASGCVVWGPADELTALIGLRDLVVVRSGKATLVCPRDRSQDVRSIVDRLAREGPSFL